MQLDVAANLLTKTKASLTSYRNTGFTAAQVIARDICKEMNEAVLKEKRLRSTRRHFNYEAPDEPFEEALKKLEVTFFNVVVDCAIESIKERFKTLDDVRKKFGVLLNFAAMDKEDVSRKCEDLSKILSSGADSDIDRTELASEINSLPSLPSHMTALELLSFIHQKQLMELYPHLWVALRIACTLPVTVASAEKSFSKLKLMKNYLRSLMGQDCLSVLTIISINQDVSSKISYDDIIDEFVLKKSRKQNF